MLVERDAQLGRLVVGIDDALAGRGGLTFVGGEAGVGKSALARALVDASRERVRVRRGGVDNVTTADALAAFQDAVPELAPRLAAEGDRVGIFRALLAALAVEPTLLVLEDLHWADEATLDALRFLGRRLDTAPVLIVVTYRHDEVTARHPLTHLLGDLAGIPRVSRLTVPPLTVDGVAALAGPGVDAVDLHGRTGGNAFFVTELLAAGSETLPATVNDAILARVARLSPAAQDVTAAAAILGTTATADLLAVVAGREVDAVDECDEFGVLVRSADGFAFRHEFARQAVEQSLSAVRRRQLHARALRELTARTPEDHRTLAHHAAGCGDDSAGEHAARAAARAARLGAHREAATQYRIALRQGAADQDRAALFVALSYECYLTDQLPEAITARQRALEAHEVGGDLTLVGDDQRWLSRLSWFLGRGADAERYAGRAIATLEPLGASPELAMAFSNRAQLRMLAFDNDAARVEGERALEMARRLGEREIEAHALNNLGAAAVNAGRIAEGEEQLARSLEIALADDLQEHAARAWTNLGSVTMEQHRLARSMDHLAAGIAYCRDRDLDSWARYMEGWRCHGLAELGRLDEALEGALALLEHPGIAPISAITAAGTAARVLARRGDDPAELLAHGTRLANETGELLRVSHMANAAAEAAWLAGDLAAIEGLTDAAWALATGHADPWPTGELAWWRTLGGVDVAVDIELAPPFALLVAGDVDGAAAAWEALGSPFWQALALGLSADLSAAERGVRMLGESGAERAVQAVLRTRRERQLPIPRRPRPETSERPHGLTARELEVLELLAEGLSTLEVAERLFISPKTAEHHIGAVLRKIGEPTRARAVAAARRSGALE